MTASFAANCRWLHCGWRTTFKFLAAFTDRATKFCVTGPHSLVKRIKDEYYKNEEAFATDLARVMNMELKELARAGARYIQIDEPYYSGFPGRPAVGREGFEYAGRRRRCEDRAACLLRQSIRQSRRGQGITDICSRPFSKQTFSKVTLEFARRGGEDLELFKEFPNKLEVGVGVIDVKTHEVETPEIVAERLRKALQYIPPERIFALPDCGCLHLPQEVAFAKLRAMVQGTRIVRKELGVS